LDDEEEADAGPPPGRRDAGDRARPDATQRSKSLLKIGLEVLLISTGVFLGLMGEQWRERARHHEVAEASLRRFREEILANRKAVAAVKDYHTTTKQSLDAFFAADARTRSTHDVTVRGIQPASFERTAWDLALMTQSLTFVDPSLAFALSRIYTTQQGYADLSRGILQAMYLLPPMSENPTPFFGALSVYYGDIVYYDPKLLELYDEILPQIDRALGETSAERPR
ncbi:MAG TPA: hypothetical protein VK504_17600, partial [Vicinamibacterales bacterium]|nr:hypothetical protein [Vicinamibacterales bacterium]